MPVEKMWKKIVKISLFQISVEGFKRIFVNCPRIEILTIQECPMFGDDAVEALTKSLPNLKSLDVSNSSGITLNSIRLIVTRLTSLTVSGLV